MTESLIGKIALVTGASGGLGVPVTRALLEAGATVIGVAPNIRESDFHDAHFTAMAVEITDLAAAKKLATEVAFRFGRIDILAHLVGGFAGGKPLPETDAELWQRMFSLNFYSALYMLQAVIPEMRRSGGGRIVAIGSRAAVEPAPGIAAYNTSKAALVSLIRTAALENRDAGITANVILPGTMDTSGNRKAMPQEDTAKWVQPASVASLIVWLAGEAGKDVNGAVIPVYGGGL
jgi:NAD(P)-dependent dehydrogenase (short-subunit alcohol dehydrogenase family)